MELNLILLIASLGLLGLVLLFALWGFLGGLKRELKCIAVFIVLLVLFWLIFGDEATILNIKQGQLVARMLGIEDNSIITVWDAIVSLAKQYIPNGETLLVDGKETYYLLRDVVSGLVRAVGLMVSTLLVVIICPIIRMITHFIGLIIKSAKKRNAKKKVANFENSNKEESEEDSAVVLNSNESGINEGVVTIDEKVLPVKPVGKKRLWGALAGTLKGVFVIILMFAPLSGIYTVLNAASDETRELISDVLYSDDKQSVADSQNTLDMVFEFVDAYESSPIGKFVEGSSYFFGNSFSTSIFDSVVRIDGEDYSLSLRKELVTLITAVNQLNGKTELGSWTNDEVANAAEVLKDSKLLVQIIPVAIEYAGETEAVAEILINAKQTVNYASLKSNDWKHDVPVILDTVKEAYRLGLFPLEEFNYLTLNANQVRNIVNTLTEAEFVDDALKMGVSIALSMDSIKEQVGQVTVPNLESIDWNKELNTIVSVYEKFQTFKIETLEGFDANEFVKDALNDEAKTKVLFDIVDLVLSLQLFDKTLVPVGIEFASRVDSLKQMLVDANQYEAFVGLKNVLTLEDVKALVQTAEVALGLVDLSEFPALKVDYLTLDDEVLTKTIDTLVTTPGLNEVLNLGIKVALSLEQVKKFTGELNSSADIDSIDWIHDLTEVVEIYKEFKTLGYTDLSEFGNKTWNEHVTEILENEEKLESVKSILTRLVNLDVFDVLGDEAAHKIVNDLIDDKFSSFSNIIVLNGLTVEEWKEDLFALLDVAKAANELEVLDNVSPFDYTKMVLDQDITIENAKLVVEKLLSLNVLGNDSTKTSLLLAALKHTKLLEVADLDLSNVVWSNETEVLKKIVDTYDKLLDVEGFDVYDLNSINLTTIIELLENDQFVDVIVEVLENLVDSDLFLDLFPSLADKYIVPLADKIAALEDDAELLKDILHNVSSEELVNEVIKLVDVLRAAVELNLFDVSEKGIGVIDLANTAALKDIVSGILDSKIIAGYEGRIIRILLKAVGLLNIEKDSETYLQIVQLDYNGEKETLLAFIDAVEPVLKNEDFSIIDSNNKLNMSLEFWTENENARTLLEAAKILVGSYDGTISGSKLIQALIPSVYDKFVEEADIIPADFQQIIYDLDVTNASGETIAHDISCLIYILDQIVLVDGQKVIVNEPIVINESLKAPLANIIDALHEIILFKGKESETLSWGLNYVANLVKIDIESTKYDFANIDWNAEKEVYKDIINDIIDLLIANEINDSNELIEVFKDIKNPNNVLVTKANANEVLDILHKVIDVKVIDAIIPLAVKFGVNIAKDNGIVVEYINQLSNEELIEDFHNLVDILDIAVNSVDIIFYYQAGLDAAVELPNREAVKSLIEPILNLNIVQHANGKLGEAVYNKLVELFVKDSSKQLVVSAEDFDFANIDLSHEGEILKAVVDALYDVLAVNNVTTVKDSVLFVKDKWYTQPSFINNETATIGIELLRTLKDSQFLGNVIEKLYNYGIDILQSKVPFSIQNMYDMSKDDLLGDIDLLCDVLLEVVDFGALQFVTDKEIDYIDLAKVEQIINHLYDLNIINKNIDQIAYRGLNYVAQLVNNKYNSNIMVHVNDIESIDFRAEFANLGEVVRSLESLLAAHELVSLTDIMIVLNDKEYSKRDFYNLATVEAIQEVALEVLDLQLMNILSQDLLNFAVDRAEKFADLSFLKGALTREEIISDLRTITNVLVPAYNAGLLDLAFGKQYSELILNFPEYKNILDVVRDLNVINKKYPELASVLANLGLAKLDSTLSVTPEDFADASFSNDVIILKKVLDKFNAITKRSNIVTVNDLLQLTKNNNFKDPIVANNDNAYTLLDAVEFLVDTTTVQSLVPVLFQYGINMAGKKDIDVSFLIEGLSKDQKIADVYELINVARDAVYVGAVEYLTTNDIAELDTDYIATMIENLYNFNILQGKMPQVLKLVTDKLYNKIVAVDLYFYLSEFEGIDYEQEFVEIADVVRCIRPFMEGNNYHSLSDLINIANNKDYKYINFYGEATQLAVQNLVKELSDVKLLGVFLPRAISYGIELAESKGIDLSFIDFEQYTQEMLLNDLAIISDAIPDIFELGAVQLVLEKKVDYIDAFAITRTLMTLSELNLLDLYYPNLAALGVNLGLEKAKIETRQFYPSDFEGIEVQEEIGNICNIILNARLIMMHNDVNSSDELLDFIKEKEFSKTEFYDEFTGELLADIVRFVSDIKTVEVLLPELLNYALTKVSKPDVSFLKDAFTKEELSSDLRKVADVIVPAIQADLVSLAFGGKVDSLPLNYTAYRAIIDAIKDLNLINKKYPTLIATLVNFGLEKVHSTQTVSATDFLNANFSSDILVIKNALYKLEAATRNANIQTVGDILNIAKEKKFTDPQYANEEVVTNLLDAVEILLDAETVQVLLPVGAQHGLEYLSEKGISLLFLLDNVGKDELVQDAHKLIDLLNDAIYVGALEYVTTKDIKQLNLNYVADMVEKVYDLNILQGNMPKLLEFASNKFAGKVKGIDLTFTKEDFEYIDFDAEFTTIANVVRTLALLLEEKQLVSLNDVTGLVNEKGYNNKAFFNESTGEILADLVRVVSDSKIVEVVLPRALSVGLSKVKTPDVSFLDDAFTKEELSSDLRKLADAIVPAIQAELVGLVYGEKVNDLPLNYNAYRAIIDAIKDLNLINKKYPTLIATLVNFGLEKVHSTQTVSATDFLNANFSSDILVIKNALHKLEAATRNANIETVGDILNIAKEKKFTDPQYANEEVVSNLLDAIEILLDAETVQVLLPVGAQHGLEYLSEKGISLLFLLDNVGKDELVQDAHKLIDLLNDAIYVGALEYVTTKDIKQLNLNYIADMVEGLYDLNILQGNMPKLLEFASNKFAGKVKGIDLTFTKEDFEHIDFNTEFVKVADIVRTLATLLNEKELVSLSDVTNFIKANEYNNKAFFNESTGEILANLVRNIADSKIVEVVLPRALTYVVNKVTAFDLSFLDGAFTKEELSGDLRMLADAIVPAIKADLVGLAFGDKVNDLEFHFEEYKEILAAIQNSVVINTKYADFLTLGVNFGFTKMNAVQSVEKADFLGSSFVDDVDHLMVAIDKVETLAIDALFNNVQDVINYIKNKGYKNDSGKIDILAHEALDVVEALVDVDTIQRLLPVLGLHLVDFANEKGIDIHYLFEDQTKETLSMDVYNIIDMAHELVNYNMIGFALFNEEIDITVIDPIHNALETIESLNILKDQNPSHLLKTIFDKLGVDTTNIDLDYINWPNEYDNIHELINIAQRFACMNDINCILKAKSFDFKPILAINQDTNLYLDIVSDALEVVTISDLFKEIVLPLTNKFVKNDNKLHAYAGLDDIYNDNNELIADLMHLDNIITGLELLDVNSFVNENGNYPLDRASIEIIDTYIIQSLFNLHYLNNTDRITILRDAIDGSVAADLSQINVSGIDLASDALIISSILQDLITVTENEYWTLINSSSKFDFKLLTQTVVIETIIDMVKKYNTTTLFEATGYSYLIFALPLMKQHAPKYYEALDLENLTVEMLENDSQYFEHMFNLLDEIDFNSTVNDKMYFTAVNKDVLKGIIEDLYELSLLEGHANDLFNLLADDFFNNKVVLGVDVPLDTLEFNHSDFDFDKALLLDLIDEVYDLFERESIVSLNDLKSFASSLKTTSNIVDFLKSQENWETISAILDTVDQSTVLRENLFRVVKYFAHPLLEQKASSLADFANFSMYTQEEFNNEIATLNVLVKQLNELGIANIIADDLIPYNEVSKIQAILSTLSQIKYINTHLDSIINKLEGKITGFDISVLSSPEFDSSLDFIALSNAYPRLVNYLVSEENQLKRVSDFTKLIKGEIKVDKAFIEGLISYGYTIVEGIEELLESPSFILLVPEIYNVVTKKAPSKFAGILETVDFDSNSFEQNKHDMILLVHILRDALDLDLYNAINNKEFTFTGTVVSTNTSTEMSKADMINSIITSVEELNCVSDYSKLTEEILEVLGISEAIDLSTVDWTVEFENIRNIVSGTIQALESLDLHNLKDVKDYFASFVPEKGLSNSAKYSAVSSKVIEFAKIVNFAELEKVTNSLDNSTLFNQLFKPLYNKYIGPKLPSKAQQLGDLSMYAIDDLDFDMHILAQLVSEFKTIRTLTGNAQENIEDPVCVQSTKAIIENIFALRLLNMKMQDIADLVDSLLPNVDLTTLDLSSLDLVNDGSIISNFAYDILVMIVESKLNAKFGILSNTRFMEHTINVYNGIIDTTLFKAINRFAYDKYVAPIASKNNIESKFLTVNETADQFAIEVGNMLEALLAMGAFSNAGIDFTDSINTDRLFGIFDNVYNLNGKLADVIAKIKVNMSEFGVIPFSYEGIGSKEDFAQLKTIYNAAMKLTSYKEDLKSNAIHTLVREVVQTDITTLVQEIASSKIAGQLLMGVVKGLTGIFTKDIVRLTIFEGVDNETLINETLPDIYNLLGRLAAVVDTNNKLVYNNAHALSDVLYAIVHLETFKDHCEELFKFALFLGGIDVREEDFSSVNWTEEYEVINQFLLALEDALEILEINNLNSVKNDVFLTSLANALPELNTSNVLPKVLRQSIEAMLKFAGKLDANLALVNRLYRSDYTDALMMEDYAKLPIFVNALVDLNFFNGGITHDNLDPAIPAVSAFFDLHYIKGDEANILSKLVANISALKDYEIDYTLVLDWELEGDAIVDILTDLVSLNELINPNEVDQNSFRDVNVQTRFKKLVDSISKSILGQQLFPQFYVEVIEPKLPADYQGIIDFSDPTFTPDMWAHEFQLLFDIYDILQSSGFDTGTLEMTVSDSITVMIKMFGTRITPSVGLHAVTSNPEYWMKLLYNKNALIVPDGASIDVTTERDWAKEPYDVFDILTKLTPFVDSEFHFTYEKVYTCNDATKLQLFFEAIVACQGTKAIMMPVICDVLNDPIIEAALNSAGLIDEDFLAEKAAYELDGSFDENYWTSAKLESFAQTIALANSL